MSCGVPDEELELSFSRSGGPGGQKVNTSATKVELRFDVDASEALSDDAKRAVREGLGTRITKDGVLVLHASEYRTQARNRSAVVARFHHLLDEALTPEAERVPTRRTRASRERRLEEKRQRAERKRLRRPPDPPGV